MKQGTQSVLGTSAPVDSGLAARWNALCAEVNGHPPIGTPGVRDVEFPCAEYDGLGYDGDGRCDSDGHYECVRCSHLSPDGPQVRGIGSEREGA
jgi:hypothetical protein